jgi:hypothetical protein
VQIAPRLLPSIAALVLGVAVTAHADEKNPAVEACAGKSEGAPCVTKRVVQEAGGEAAPKDEPGTCQPDQCCELDYSQGSPPKSNCGPCLACKPGAPATPTGSEGGVNDTHHEPPRGDEGGPPATEPSKKGCAIGADSFGTPWLMVLLVAWRRRKR